MNDARTMRCVQPVRDLNPVLKRLLELQSSFLQSLRQRFPFDVFHDEVVDTVLFADVIKGADVKMVELRDRLASRSNRALRSGLSARCSGKTLMATVQVEAGVRAFVHLAHSSLANR